ncbi:nucleotide-binding protein, putative [Bodo saltans]|uniref:Nucleotide-binding protein, putative n=1 Tax=Bodo saltans TaxID=75058 RepID=A0A0S4JKD1_BODSA|nr:nucleotide-binding protein, putative [Bodo saltans]|eukprot:CUG89863.1 nucleotide-binding protein, putative [Bodo saltans]
MSTDDHIIEIVPCSQNSISHIIGPGGETIQRLQAETNTRIEIIAGPKVSITGTKQEEVSAAKEKIEAIIEHQANPDYEGEEGRTLRHQATEFASARTLKMKEADAAFAANDKQKGHDLLQEAKRLGEEMRQSNADAGRAIIAFNNHENGDSVLDLHGLRAEEAVDAVKLRLNHLAAVNSSKSSSSSVASVDVICGAGLHTKAGHAVALMPAVEKYLRENNFVFVKRGVATLVVNLIEDIANRSGSGDVEPATSGSTIEASPAVVEAPVAQSVASSPAVNVANEAKPATAVAPPSASPTPAGQKTKDSTNSCCAVM